MNEEEYIKSRQPGWRVKPIFSIKEECFEQGKAASRYQKPSHLCITKFCRHQRSAHARRCPKCRLREWRAKYPISARLAMLRDRAARKKVPFDLTLEWLTEFLIANAYDPTEHHIDRIKTWLGYTKDNLRVLSSSENIAKGNRERYGKMELPF